MQIEANLIDIAARRIGAAEVTICADRIDHIEVLLGGAIDKTLPFMLPGFIDSHVHIESSMLVPSEFARLAVRHGTIATVSDPHEIANVVGIDGIDFMIADGNRVPLKFFFGAPSCVPATSFETSGATIDASGVASLLRREDIYFLAEMMNYPGVLAKDRQVWQKLQAARQSGKPVDGHAPGLTGEQAVDYIQAGIRTDHECTTLAEAEHKLGHGMKILIREGSAAKNFDALYPLIDRAPDDVMLCSDDKHPDDLAESHINELVRRAVTRGCDLFHVLAAACLNPIDHYRLPLGRLRVGDPADFVIVDDMEKWNVQQTYINGQLVADAGHSLIDPVQTPIINRFDCQGKKPDDFALPATHPPVRAIQAIDGSLVTESIFVDPASTPELAKLAVVNRYQDRPVAACYVRGFGIQRGAIASCVGHDSHNIVAVGLDDAELCHAVNLVIEHRGGIAAVNDGDHQILPLPVAGIMATSDGEMVARQYRRMDQFAKQALGATLSAPFMTLSFMPLLVIPSLKLSDRGLFDSNEFRFVDA